MRADLATPKSPCGQPDAVLLRRVPEAGLGPAPPAHGDPVTPTVPLDPALRRWRWEMRHGRRTWATHDALRLAAEWESGARTLEAQGATESAARCRARAQAIIHEAAAHWRQLA